ncbi:MAG: hypothetical protein HZB53_17365 [Chloroflexi bacterium]|nr:hypothetical protein [Chloroflexota bacterium]
MKLARLAFVIAAIALAGLYTAAVARATPAADPEPSDAPYIDLESHTIAPHTVQWYRFEFVVDQPGFLCHFLPCPNRAVYSGNAVIRLNGLARSGIRFELYAPEQIANWRDTGPIGAGGESDQDLIWAGESSTNGTWYVRVVNDRGYPITYRFAIAGIRIALYRTPVPTATPWSVAAAVEAARGGGATPTPTAKPLGHNISPDTALMIDERTQTIASNSDLWYTAAFPMNPDPIAIRLIDGASTGLAFELYMPAQAATWWKDDPLGRGGIVGNDLVWAGSPDTNDRRLIRVINRTGRAVSFAFSVQSTRPSAPAPLPFTFY